MGGSGPPDLNCVLVGVNKFVINSLCRGLLKNGYGLIAIADVLSVSNRVDNFMT